MLIIKIGLSNKFFGTENLGDDLNQKTFDSLFYIFKNWWFYFWKWICPIQPEQQTAVPQ